MDLHNTKLASLSAQVATFHRTNTPFRIYHGSTNSTRIVRWKSNQVLDTSKLTKIISIDESKQTCLVEANVSFNTLVKATLKHNLIPPVVPDLPSITIGGAFAGTAGESSSWKYGFVDGNVNWIEIILATGEIVTASSSITDPRHDLFRGGAGSLGTLGVITLLELRLVSAKRWVELTYRPVDGIESAQREMRRVIKDPDTDVQFVDGILFSSDRGVVMTGKMVDEPSRSEEGIKPNLPIQTFNRASDPWFYMHAESFTTSKKHDGDETPQSELIPLTSYLFRYDRGCFWTGTLAFSYFFGSLFLFFTPFMRWLLDYFMHAEIMYHAWHRSGLSSSGYLVQDLAVPGENAPELIRWLKHAIPSTPVAEGDKGKREGEGGCWPLWLCPLQVRKCGLNARSLGKSDKPTAMLNVGIWVKLPTNTTTNTTSNDAAAAAAANSSTGARQTAAAVVVDEFVALNRRLEAKLLSLEGIKWLYAQCFYTEREFWAVYDREAYEALRRKYVFSSEGQQRREDVKKKNNNNTDNIKGDENRQGNTILPNVYDKVKIDVEAERAVKLTGIWSVWPLAGMYGVLSALKGGSYLVR